MSVRNPEPDAVSEPGMDRRGLMRNAAGMGAAGIAAGVLLTAGPASAAEPAAPAAGAKAGQAPVSQEPLVVHVRDAATGELDLYQGERHRRVVDRDLAAALARHAR